MRRRYRVERFSRVDLGEFDRLADELISRLPGQLLARPVLRPGSRGSAVAELQNLLDRAGYSLVRDGIFGVATEAAVRGFQRIQGLSADGIVGPRTWSALRTGAKPEFPEPLSQAEFTWPVAGRLTSRFGPRINPVTQEYQSLHNGIDIAAPAGTPVMAAADGIAYPTDNDPVSGHFIYVEHPGNSSSYSHLSGINVKKGQRVLQGDVIGWVGSTGRSTGPHLHFRINNAQGVAIDPLSVLPARSGNDFEAFADELEADLFGDDGPIQGSRPSTWPR